MTSDTFSKENKRRKPQSHHLQPGPGRNRLDSQLFLQIQKKDVVRSVRSIIGLHGLMIVDKVDWLYALDLYASKKVKLIDCLIASKKEIREKKWTIVTHDSDFKKINVKSLTPSEI